MMISRAFFFFKIGSFRMIEKFIQFFLLKWDAYIRSPPAFNYFEKEIMISLSFFLLPAR